MNKNIVSLVSMALESPTSSFFQVSLRKWLDRAVSFPALCSLLKRQDTLTPGGYIHSVIACQQRAGPKNYFMMFLWICMAPLSPYSNWTQLLHAAHSVSGTEHPQSCFTGTPTAKAQILPVLPLSNTQVKGVCITWAAHLPPWLCPTQSCHDSTDQLQLSTIALEELKDVDAFCSSFIIQQHSGFGCGSSWSKIRTCCISSKCLQVLKTSLAIQAYSSWTPICSWVSTSHIPEYFFPYVVCRR